MLILLNKTSFKPYANLIQLAGFQLVWFAWALGVPAGLLWPGTVASVVFLALHGLWRTNAKVDRRAVLMSVLCGLGLDSALMQLGLLTFAIPNPAPLNHWQPWWMGLLWACLGCTLHHSLAWLRPRPMLAAGLGAVSGLLSYEAAARMGALSLPRPELAWPLLAVFWAVFVPWAQRPETQTPADSLG